MKRSDPFLDERILQVMAASGGPISVQDIAKESGEHIGPVWASVRRLAADGLAEERNGGYSYTTTPEGQRRGADAIVAALAAEMQNGFQADRAAIVASATHVMDEANKNKILTLVGRSSAPTSRNLLATTIGEDLDTVADLVAELAADGLIEPHMDGQSYAATDKGRRAAADPTDIEMQELFSSERDAIVASAGALMATDIEDVLWFEAAEEDRQRTGLTASLTYDGADEWTSAVAKRTPVPAEVALARATRAAREATAQFCRTKSRADATRALEATRLVRARIEALEGGAR